MNSEQPFLTGLSVGVRLVYLPLYTPEFQPTEHLWRLVDAHQTRRSALSPHD